MDSVTHSDFEAKGIDCSMNIIFSCVVLLVKVLAFDSVEKVSE